VNTRCLRVKDQEINCPILNAVCVREVNDFSASAIAIYFYRYLLNDNSLGRSLMLAKSEFYNNYSYDLSWLTYTLYGNPNAKLKFVSSRNIEEEIRSYLKNKGPVGISRLAHDLKIDITLASQLINSMKQKKTLAKPTYQSIKEDPDYAKTDDRGLEKFIKKGESETLEFKASMLYPFDRPKPVLAYEKELAEIERNTSQDEPAKKAKIREINLAMQKLIDSQPHELEIEVLKTIAAFLNSRGGILLVGIKDDGTACGIESDYPLLSTRQDSDGWLHCN
jgi:Putative DNA-binding domain